MKKLQFSLQFLLGIFPLVVICQTTNPTEVPNVIPPTPETAQFTKYVDFPANLSIGMANTTIPIYTIETNELSVPISLSYDASGLKPNEDETGVIGLKWSLNAFGTVSRSINNKRDEDYYSSEIANASTYEGLYNFCGAISGTNYNYDNEYWSLEQVSNGNDDQEPDIYTYKLPDGGNNKFVFSRGSTTNDFNPILLKQSSDKIDYQSTGVGGIGGLEYFEITDTRGVQYRFGENFSGSEDVTEFSSKGITSWLLTEMVSATKKDTIYFEYDDVLFYNAASSSYGANKYKKLATFAQESNFYQEYDSNSQNYVDQTNYKTSQTPLVYTYTQKKIKKIRFKSGYVDFIYQFIDNQTVLQYIKVYNSSGALIRNVELQQSKFQNVTSNQINWLKLDKIRFLDDLASQSQDYSFDYITGTFPTNHQGNIPSSYPYGYALSFAIDHWGFYNGKNNNNGLMPTDIDLSWPEVEIYSVSSSIGGDRSPNSNYAKIGMLQTITFPTGGTRAFEYEGNTYKEGTSNNNPIGGLRIKKITNLTQGDEIVHTYDYGTGGDSRVYNILDFYRTYKASFQDTNFSNDILDEWFSISSEPKVDIMLNGVPVIYRVVNEYIGTSTENQGKITHTFNGGGLSMNLYPYTAPYNCPGSFPFCVIGYPMDQAKYSSTITRYFHNVSFPEINEKNTVYYNAQNDIVKEVINGYNNSSTGEAIKGFRSEQVGFAIGGTIKSLSSFHFYNYGIDIRHNNPGSATVIEYDNNVPTITTQTTYEYNSKYLVSSKTETTSNGDILKTSYLYPFDLIGIEQSPYMQGLTDANRISTPVVTIQFRVDENENETKLSEQHIKYGLSTNTGNILLPTEVHSNKGTSTININSSADKRIDFLKYSPSTGSLTEHKQTDGTTVVYLWGYNEQYPVAKIEKSTLASVEATLTPTELTNIKSGSYNMATMITKLNKIRTGLSGAMVTTYTYDPLVGVTSITDPKGYTMYYEYDDFNRLKQVKDAAGILSVNEYHYKNQ